MCSTVLLLEVVVGSELRGAAGEGAVYDLTAEWRAVQVEGDYESCRDHWAIFTSDMSLLCRCYHYSAGH